MLKGPGRARGFIQLVIVWPSKSTVAAVLVLHYGRCRFQLGCHVMEYSFTPMNPNSTSNASLFLIHLHIQYLCRKLLPRLSVILRIALLLPHLQYYCKRGNSHQWSRFRYRGASASKRLLLQGGKILRTVPDLIRVNIVPLWFFCRPQEFLCLFDNIRARNFGPL